jgi:hypothetical protein
MRFPRYWAKGATTSGFRMRNPRTGEMMQVLACWGWSDESEEKAAAKGRERADAIAEMIRRGNRPDRYLYGDTPMREEVIDEWKRSDATTYAAVSLNSYGCQVLNTATIMFVDVDLPEVPVWEAVKFGLSRLFGNRGPSPRERQESHAMERVRDMIQADASCGVRAYRTRGGLRYLFTHAPADPTAESTVRVMEDLGADPLYIRLCKVQECFRARLTPKPWRCGLPALRVSYPWRDDRAEREARDWIKNYTRTAEAYATCSFLEHLGSTRMDVEVNRVVKFHDETTKSMSDLELA